MPTDNKRWSNVNRKKVEIRWKYFMKFWKKLDYEVEWNLIIYKVEYFCLYFFRISVAGKKI